MPTLNPKLIAAAALALALFSAGWLVNGWRLESQITALKTAQAITETELRANANIAKREAESAKREAADAVSSALDELHRSEQNAQTETDRLRTAVANRDKRLLIRAHCPAVGGVPENGSPASGVDEPAVELDADARPAYFALRSAIESDAGKITALQKYASACYRLTN